MEFRPILSSLTRHKITSSLLILEIALTCAIVCNAVFLISHRLQHMEIPSGVAEQSLVQIELADIASPPDVYARAQEDLALLRQVPGVQSVALTNQLPLQGSGSANFSLKLDPAQQAPTVNAASYFGKNLAQTLGSRLIAGRDLAPGDFVNADVVIKALASGDTKGAPAVAVITKALADRLWPGESALGKIVYVTDQLGVRVVGVIAGLARANAYSDASAQYSVILPVFMGASKGQSYVLRTRPEDRQRVLSAAVTALAKANPGRVISKQRTYEEVRDKFFANDRAMAGTLVGVIAALLVVTALGIVGLASFWVGQRRRSIGVRRALGATRTDILRYFQSENFLIASFGIALGMTMAYGINQYLMTHYELPRLPAVYLPTGAVALWVIGQLAVLGPALRAAAIPPVAATRAG